MFGTGCSVKLGNDPQSDPLISSESAWRVMGIGAAMEDLLSFHPETARAAGDQGNSLVQREQDIREFIRRAGAFGQALREAGQHGCLEESLAALHACIGPSSELEIARRQVGEEQLRVAGDGSGYLLLPTHIVAAQSRANLLLGCSCSETDLAALQRWADALFDVNRRIESDNLWGKSIILMCAAVYGQELRHVINSKLYEDLVTAFSDLLPALRAVQSAARYIADDVTRETSGTGTPAHSAAYETAAPSQPAGTDTPSGHRAEFLGEGRYQVGETVLTLGSAQAKVLESLVELRTASKQRLVDVSGTDDAPRVLKTIRTNHPELARFIQLPGRKGAGGYRTSIVDARSKSPQ